MQNTTWFQELKGSVLYTEYKWLLITVVCCKGSESYPDGELKVSPF